MEDCRWNNCLHILLEDILNKMLEDHKFAQFLIESGHILDYLNNVISAYTTHTHGCLGVWIRIANKINNN